MLQSSLLEKTSVLMLSTGFEPLFQTSWRRALTAVYGGRAEIIEAHESLVIGTTRGPVPFPLKVRFITGIIAARVKKLSTHAILSKKNLFIRDRGACQYCDMNISLKHGTVDHVIPKSRGGKHRWENVVLSCVRCNQAKGDKLPSEFHLKLLMMPKVPTILEVTNSRFKVKS